MAAVETRRARRKAVNERLENLARGRGDLASAVEAGAAEGVCGLAQPPCHSDRP